MQKVFSCYDIIIAVVDDILTWSNLYYVIMTARSPLTWCDFDPDGIICFCRQWPQSPTSLAQDGPRLFYSLHCTSLMAGNLPAIRAVQWTVSDLWKSVSIPTSHMIPQCIAAHPEPTAFEGIPQSIFRPASCIIAVTPSNWRPSCLIPTDSLTPTKWLCSSLAPVWCDFDLYGIIFPSLAYPESSAILAQYGHMPSSLPAINSTRLSALYMNVSVN